MDISSMQGVRTDISEMISKIREVSTKTNVFSDKLSVSPDLSVSSTKSFDNVLSLAKDSLSNVSSLNAETERLKNAYVTGDSSVSMSQVIVASQKSKLAFEGLISVRNKILDAYKEVMEMPV